MLAGCEGRGGVPGSPGAEGCRTRHTDPMVWEPLPSFRQGGIARLLEERGRRPRLVLPDGVAGASRGMSVPPRAAIPSLLCAPMKRGVRESPHLPGLRPGLFSKTHRVHESREGGDIAHFARTERCPPCARLGAQGGGPLSRISARVLTC